MLFLSYFSPLLKSIGARSSENEYFRIGEDLEEREEFISVLESRFFYLAADARATLRLSSFYFFVCSRTTRIKYFMLDSHLFDQHVHFI